MKKLGILGGLGPLASARFYERLTRLQTVEREQDYIDLVLISRPSIPDRTAFITGASGDDPAPALQAAARALAQCGAEVIAIPCVTAHFFYEAIRQTADAPVLHIVEETADALKRRGVKKAGLLATDGTRHARLFDVALAARGIACLHLPEGAQRRLMEFIYGGLKRGDFSSAELCTLANLLRARGAETVVLGCTELSLAQAQTEAADFTDALEELARAAITACGARVR